jgi:hypothetical protein
MTLISLTYVFKASPWCRGRKISLDVPDTLPKNNKIGVGEAREERDRNKAAATAIPIGFSSTGTALLQAASTTFDLDGSGSGGRSGRWGCVERGSREGEQGG